MTVDCSGLRDNMVRRSLQRPLFEQMEHRSHSRRCLDQGKRAGKKDKSRPKAASARV